MPEPDFRRNNFDLIRLFAATQVVIVHAYEHLGLDKDNWFIRVLTMFPGVPIFFVISGYLISASLERSPSLKCYFKNRILRIYPALWCCFFVSVALVLLVYGYRGSFADWCYWGLAQLSIGQFYNPDFMREFGVGVLNGSLWTIPVEIQFYLVLPLFYASMRRICWNKTIVGLTFLALIWVNVVYVRLKTSGDELSILVKLFGVSVLPYFYLFLVGVGLQRSRLLVGKLLVGRFCYWLFAYVVLSIGMAELGFRTSGNYLNPVLAVMLACSVISLGHSFVELIGKPLRGNDVSYGLYIYHMLVINVMVHFGVVGEIVHVGVVLAISAVLAWGSWQLVEKTALRRKAYTLRSTKAG